MPNTLNKRSSVLFVLTTLLMVIYLGIHISTILGSDQNSAVLMPSSLLLQVPIAASERVNNLEYINTGLLAGVLGLLGYALLMVRKNEIMNTSISVALTGYDGKGGGIVDRLAALEIGRHTNETAILGLASRLTLLDAQQAEVNKALTHLLTDFKECQLTNRVREERSREDREHG